MLDTYTTLGYYRNDDQTSSLQAFQVVSHLVFYLRQSDALCKTSDYIDMNGKSSSLDSAQRRAMADNGRVIQDPLPMRSDNNARNPWGNSIVNTLRHANVNVNMRYSAWGTQPWNHSQSLFTSSKDVPVYNSEHTRESVLKVAKDLHPQKSNTCEANVNHVANDSHSESFTGNIMIAKGKRASSMSGSFAYPQVGRNPAEALKSGPKVASDKVGSNYTQNEDLSEEIRKYIRDLRNKRMANQNYPHEASSYFNNKFVYKLGPLGFKSIVWDAECHELVRSNASTLPFSVFCDFTPSQQETNAIDVSAGEKVDVIARIDNWIYVRIAHSYYTERVGLNGWIPLHCLLEPELFTRGLHYTSHTHTITDSI